MSETRELRAEAMQRGREAARAYAGRIQSNVVQDTVVVGAVEAALKVAVQYISAPEPQPPLWRRLLKPTRWITGPSRN